MKASFVLALPALALAAATPQVEERQIVPLPTFSQLLNFLNLTRGTLLKTECLAEIEGISNCVTGGIPPNDPTIALGALQNCAILLVFQAVGCVVPVPA
ncbi:hypothetical protein ACHAPJ_004000 [Fusarium lateritium]